MAAPGLIGTTLGGYAVEALLGSGGMASVYCGLDLHLQRPVAIKVLADRAAALPGFADRFRQEARLVANLRHPNIVQIYAFGEERGLTYMVQELLPGPTLEQRMADATQQGQFLPPDKVTAIVAQLAAALDAAHTAGVIHRDVKPANALWNAAGLLILTDFGIAKDLGGAINQTQAGTVMGTPTYMAPEQAQGLPLSPATDIYALGVILYELLTNRVPFTGAQPLAVLLQHAQDAPPSPRTLRLDLPPAVEAVVLRALAKEPAARYASAGALAQALQQAWAPALAADIHQLATRPWTPGPGTPLASPRATPAGAAMPRPAPSPGSAASGGQPAQQPAPAAPRQPPAASPGPAARRSSLLLPVLGALLLLAFVGAAALALRGNRQESPQVTSPTTAATQRAQTTDATVAAATTAVAQAPAITEEPAPAPDAPTAAAAGGPVAEVRELLAAGVRDGSAGPQGETLLATLDAAQQALDQGDTAGATTQLFALQRTLLQEARAGMLAPELLRQALSGIDAIADDDQLTLPLSVSAD